MAAGDPNRSPRSRARTVPSPRQHLTGRQFDRPFSNDRPRVRHAHIISAIAFVFDRNNGEPPSQDARPWPIACRNLRIGPLTNRLPRVGRSHASPVSPQDDLMGLRRGSVQLL